MIAIKKFVFNTFSVNTYIVWDEETRESAVIDPGCSDSLEEKILSDFISEKDIVVRYLLITHCHIDHILGINFVRQKFDPVYLAPEKDLLLLQHADKQAAAFGMKINTPQMPDEYLEERKTLSLGSSEIKIFFTPGHSPGEHCLYFVKEHLCISGDVLFKGSIGRTDLWGGDYNTLIESIKTKLFNLPDETIIYPGHGENSMIGIEKKENPFLQGI